MPENNEDDSGKRDIGGYAKYSAMGFQMIAIIGICTYAGYKIDQYAQHQTKWVTAILSLAGVLISLYVVIRSVKKG